MNQGEMALISSLCW